MHMLGILEGPPYAFRGILFVLSIYFLSNQLYSPLLSYPATTRKGPLKRMVSYLDKEYVKYFSDQILLHLSV